MIRNIKLRYHLLMMAIWDKLLLTDYFGKRRKYHQAFIRHCNKFFESY